MKFTLIKELMSFHLMGLPTFHNKNSGSCTQFPTVLYECWFLMTSSWNLMTSSLKSKKFIYNFAPRQTYYQIAKFGQVWRDTSEDKRGRLIYTLFYKNRIRFFEPRWFLRNRDFEPENIIRWFLNFLVKISLNFH